MKTTLLITALTLIASATEILGSENIESSKLTAMYEASEEHTATEDDFLKLSGRYGKKAASNLVKGILRTGYSKDMVYQAKGTPLEIEEPFGRMMDYEVLVYADMKIYVDYGIITAIEQL